MFEPASTSVMLLNLGSAARGASQLPGHAGSFELAAFALGSAGNGDPDRPLELRVQLSDGTDTGGLASMVERGTVMEGAELVLGLLEPETRRLAPLVRVFLYDTVVASVEGTLLALHAVQVTAGSLVPDHSGSSLAAEGDGQAVEGLAEDGSGHHSDGDEESGGVLPVPEPQEMTDADFDFGTGEPGEAETAGGFGLDREGEELQVT